MEKFKVKFYFDKENSKIYEIPGESTEQLLCYIVGHKEWYINTELGVAVNMRQVTRVAILEPTSVAKARTVRTLY